MFRKLLSGLGALAVTAALAYGANLPLISPSSVPGLNEPSQFISSMNQVINQLSGNVGYAPAQVVSIGSSGTISGATPQTLNTQRGIVTFTGVTVAAVTTVPVVITNSLITAASLCTASIVSDNSAAASFPYIRSIVPTASTLTVNISNAAAATSTGSSSFGIAYQCS